MTRTSVVFFDLDDTLFQHSESVADGVLAHRRAHGGRLAKADDTGELIRWLELEEHHYHRYLRGEIGFLEQRRARARDFVASFDIDLASDDAADRWFTAYLAHYRRSWKLHDDAMPCLDELAASDPELRFGIITNAVIAFQTEKLDALRLSERMDGVIASGEFGVAKPDPRIFWHACDQFQVPTAQALYVGDRLHTDAIGASAAGLRGVWLCRTREPDAAELDAAATSDVLIISTLAEVPAAVR